MPNTEFSSFCSLSDTSGHGGQRFSKAPEEIQSSHLAAVSRRPTWPIRDDLSVRCGRDRRRVPGAGHAAAADSLRSSALATEFSDVRRSRNAPASAPQERLNLAAA